MQNVPAPVVQPVVPGLLKLFAAACLYTDTPIDQARKRHEEFMQLRGACNRDQWDLQGRCGFRHRNSTEFLHQERDRIDPKIGLFKALHLLECDLHVLRRCSRKKLRTVLTRAQQMYALTLHFQDRLGWLENGFGDYTREVHRELTLLARRQEGGGSETAHKNGGSASAQS